MERNIKWRKRIKTEKRNERKNISWKRNEKLVGKDEMKKRKKKIRKTPKEREK